MFTFFTDKKILAYDKQIEWIEWMNIVNKLAPLMVEIKLVEEEGEHGVAPTCFIKDTNRKM